MSAPAVPHQPADLDAAWLTAALAHAGHDVEVAAVEQEPVGTGQMGVSVRLRTTYAGDPEGLPPTFVAKLPTADLPARAGLAHAHRSEVAFYRELAPTVAVRAPGCHHAAITDDGADFVLLLEDLAPAEPGDQLAGCSVAEAEVAVVNLAGLHGPRWGDPALVGTATLERVDAEGAAFLGALLADATTTFLERYGARLHDGDAAVLRRAAEAVGTWAVTPAERFSLLHGDYRLDNLLFAPSPATGVAAVDWQTLGLGLPTRDLAYLLETSLLPHDRRAHEEQLVGAYHGALLAHGVGGYPLDECWDDYRRGTLQGPLITVLGAAYSTRTDRGDEMFVAMATRSCEAIRDLDPFALL